ncbi:MAG: helix-turn-helix transcriptional regulator [Acetatifactor sp.]
MFKDNLAALRKLHGFSQDELADRIGITRQTMSKYETGGSLS